MKIFCIGRNYAEHAQELNNELPPEPVIFLKPKSALLLPHMQFYYPVFTNELHYEAEIVLRICKNGKHINEGQGSKYFNAITVGIDFTARDVQRELKQKSLPWEKAKAWDDSAIIGEWRNITPGIATNDIGFSMQLNDVVVQRGNSQNMLFSFDQIIVNISQYFAINIGDLVFTGTPSGVGECVVGDILKGYLADERVFELEVK